MADGKLIDQGKSPPASGLYQQLRLRLTGWYLLLTGITSIALVVAGTWLCYKSINDSLNRSLEELIASNLPQVENRDGQLHFVFAREKVSSQWAHQQSTLQLYDSHGSLVEEFGPPGARQISEDKDYFEAMSGDRKVRGTSDPIMVNGKVVGHIAAQVPVEIRDKATMEFALVMAAIMPLLLAALAGSGYFFSGKASKPAEQAFTLLRQFMADASHELRTPVHAIQLMAENVAAEAQPESQLVKDMESITKSTDRMAKLIDDMMMLTKLEIQQIPLKIEPVKIDTLVRDALDELAPVAAEKQIAVETAMLHPATADGDNAALHRVVTNLLQNALRYTDSGGRVSVSVYCAGESAVIEVSDTGIGIDAASLPHIFDRFFRVDKSRSRAVGGSGLGLAIVKAICEQHKGSISVRSEEGRGTTFIVSLPRSV